MKILLKTPLDLSSGYGNDGCGLARALVRLGHDVRLFPVNVAPPIPAEVAEMLTWSYEPPFDVTIIHADPMSMLLEPATRQVSMRVLGWCHDPEARVLTAELEWKPIVKLEVGEGIVAFDEEATASAWTPKGAKRTASVRKFRTGTITQTQQRVMRRVRVKTDRGETVVTPDHRFLVIRLKSRDVRDRRAVWVEAQDLQTTDEILALPMWEEDRSYEAGYIAGQYDGEGHLSPLTGPPKQRQCYANLAWSQLAESPLVPYFEGVVASLGFTTSRYLWGPDDKPGHYGRHQMANVSLTGGWLEILRMLGTVRPKRMLANPNLAALWTGRGVRGLPVAKVQDVECLEDGLMVAIETDTATYVADGLLGHNSMWEWKQYKPSHGPGPKNFRKRLKDFDALVCYDEVTKEALGPWAPEGVRTPVLQGGFWSDDWPESKVRDWGQEPFRFVMAGQLHAQPLDAKVLTPVGWVRMGDVRIGDALVDPDGGIQKIEEISARSVAPVFEVKFSDGSVTRCTSDHLWRVDRKRQRKPYATWGSAPRFWDDWEVVATSEMVKRGLKGPSGFRFRVPTPRVDFEAGRMLPLDPYLLGALLGDGNSPQRPGSTTFSNVDEDCLAEVRRVLPPGVALQQKDSKNWRFVGKFPGRPTKGLSHAIVGRGLQDLGLRGVVTPDKFVPDRYLFASEEDRRSLLSGLLDTDGWNCRSGAGFSSSSPALVEAVVFLVRSLGGVASVGATKLPRYRYRGEDRVGKPHQEVRLQTPFNPFRMARKTRAWTPGMGVQDVLSRRIVSIREVGEEQVQCIGVSGDSGTYVTDDCIVTHNTRKDPFAAIEAFAHLKRMHGDSFKATLTLKTTTGGLHPMMEDAYDGLEIHHKYWDQARMYDLFANAHCLLAPSKGEGKNLPALEMMSTGGVVIATNFGGHTQWLSPEYAYPLAYELVDEGSGLAARADRADLARLMWHVYTERDEARRKGEIAARTVRAMCDWVPVARHLIDEVNRIPPRSVITGTLG